MNVAMTMGFTVLPLMVGARVHRLRKRLERCHQQRNFDG